MSESTVVVIVFLLGFCFAMFLVWQSLPFMLSFFAKMTEIEKTASYVQGKNDVLGSWLGVQAGQNDKLITGLIEVAKVPSPLPLSSTVAENPYNTLTHSLTHSENTKSVPEKKPLKFIVRKSAMSKGKFEGNFKTIYFEPVGTDNRFSVDVVKGRLVEFEGLKVWAGICLHCENRFVTAKQDTQFCCASCNQNFNHGKV